ncbi:hypothetical protein JJJ17_06700 [Paracoccus caeni]|uniref:Uncharacterized protein n=1 Tax=Paracoccus caeni TaxID=657651 RepID=A0A934W0A2_9RHOB|nr:hypothetical protein [Paracoccus caeni]MBK4215609.1 hypothetical protein [Paracoccus caeni]
MASPLLIDDLSEYLGNLPDWYIQILEEREKDECEVCPDDWIELILEDFDGRPITGEPYFVLTEATDGSAIASPSPASGPFTDGAGRTTPARLNLRLGADVVDVAYGAKTTVSLNLTDERFGEFEPYDEQLYLVDTPLTYDGPLQVSGDVRSVSAASYNYWLEVTNSAKAGVPYEAILDMMAEVDTAYRSGLGIYGDLSLTARNAAEGYLLMAMQGVPPNAHKASGARQIFEPVEEVFSTGMGAIAGSIFVGPDGVSYRDDYVSSHSETSAGDWQIFRMWKAVAMMLELFEGTISNAQIDADVDDFLNRAAETFEGLWSYAGSLIASPAHAEQRGGGGRGRGTSMRGTGTGRFPKRGNGSNKRASAASRNGYVAHTQAASRRPSKSGKAHTFNGAKFNLRHSIRHFFDGDGVRTNGQFNGGHTSQTFMRDLQVSGGRYLSSRAHPDGKYGKGIIEQSYQPRRQSGSMPGQPPRAAGGQYAKRETKTIVDLSQRPAREVLRDMREALKNAMMRPSFKPNASSNSVTGHTKTGIRVDFHITGHGNSQYTIRSFYYVVPQQR